jgi:hypothetical protein
LQMQTAGDSTGVGVELIQDKTTADPQYAKGVERLSQLIQRNTGQK